MSLTFGALFFFFSAYYHEYDYKTTICSGLAVQPNRNEEEDNESYEDKQEAIFGLAESTTGNEQGEQIRRTITMVCMYVSMYDSVLLHYSRLHHFLTLPFFNLKNDDYIYIYKKSIGMALW